MCRLAERESRRRANRRCYRRKTSLAFAHPAAAVLSVIDYKWWLLRERRQRETQRRRHGNRAREREGLRPMASYQHSRHRHRRRFGLSRLSSPSLWWPLWFVARGGLAGIVAVDSSIESSIESFNISAPAPISIISSKLLQLKPLINSNQNHLTLTP